MKHNQIKQLKQRIKELQEENSFLKNGVDVREDAHNFVSEKLDISMAVTQEISFLLVYLEAIETLIKDEYSTNAKTIRRAINKFKSELIDGFANNHLIHTLCKKQNKLDNN